MKQDASPGWEKKSDPLLAWDKFFLRWLRWVGAALLITGVSLCGGAFGYRWTEGMDWLEAFLNAAMILTGMGPVSTLHTANGKVFAICYALFSSGIFVVVAAMLVGPAAHRFLHRFHLDED
jgi:hypothetical protein